MLNHNCQSPTPIFWEWNRKTFLGNFVSGERDLEKKFFWQWELKQLLSILWYTLGVLKYEWNQLEMLRLGTRNLIDVFPNLILRNAWFLTDCFVQGSSKNTAAPMNYMNHCTNVSLHQWITWISHTLLQMCVIFKWFISNCTFLQQISAELIFYQWFGPVF